MAGETCEYVGVDEKVCGELAVPCSSCLKAFCRNCLVAHYKQEHPIQEVSIELAAVPVEAQNPSEPTKASVFDQLFVPPSAIKPSEPPVELPQEPEEPITEEEVGEMFSAEMGRVVEALDKLARRGLNQSAVIALIHDAEPKIPKSTITTVLKTLRQLPDIYGRKKPGRKGC